MLGKSDHVTKTKTGTSSVPSDDLGLSPAKGNINLEFSSIYHDSIIAKNVGFLLGVTIKEAGLSVENSVLSRRSGVEGDISDLGYFLF